MCEPLRSVVDLINKQPATESVVLHQCGRQKLRLQKREIALSVGRCCISSFDDQLLQPLTVSHNNLFQRNRAQPLQSTGKEEVLGIQEYTRVMRL